MQCEYVYMLFKLHAHTVLPYPNSAVVHVKGCEPCRAEPSTG